MAGTVLILQSLATAAACKPHPDRAETRNVRAEAHDRDVLVPVASGTDRVGGISEPRWLEEVTLAEDDLARSLGGELQETVRSSLRMPGASLTRFNAQPADAAARLLAGHPAAAIECHAGALDRARVRRFRYSHGHGPYRLTRWRSCG